MFGKKLLLAFLASLLSFLLFATAFDFGIVRTAGNRDNIKGILSQSGIYDSVLPSLLADAGKINTSSGSLSLSDPAVIQAANQAITPKLLEQNANGAIDNIYDWLDGSLPSPDFQLDFSSAKVNFATNVGEAVKTKALTLPACANNVTATSFDVYNSTCLPKTVKPDSLALAVRNEILRGQGFLDNPVIGANTIKNPDTNQSIFDGQLKKVPTWYQRIKKTPIILAVLALLTMVGIIFLSSSPSAGFRRVGFTLLVTGLVMLAFAWVFNRGVNSKVVPKIKMDNKVMQQKVRTVLTDVSGQIDRNYWQFGGLYTALGILAVGASVLQTRQPKPSRHASDPAAPAAAAPPAAETAHHPHAQHPQTAHDGQPQPAVHPYRTPEHRQYHRPPTRRIQ